MIETLLRKAQEIIEDRPEISESTANSYRRAITRLHQGSPRVGCKATHYHLRAALGWYHYDSIFRLCNELKVADSADQPRLASALSVELVTLAAFRNATSSGAASELAYQGGRHVSRGKRRGLGTLPADWREQLLAKAAVDELPYLLVLILTGCRPSELALGIKANCRKQMLYLGIKGSKVTSSNGQPQRLLGIDLSHLWGQQLANALAHWSVPVTLQMKAGLLAALVKRVAGRVQFVGEQQDYVISPYSFRHQLAADLKRQGETPAWIAAVLGHRSERTQTAYGHWRQGCSGAGGLIQSVAVSHQPRTHTSRYMPAGATHSTANHRIVIVSSQITAHSSPPSAGVPALGAGRSPSRLSSGALSS